MTRTRIAVSLALVAVACVSMKDEPHDPKKRSALFEPVKALEGSWEAPGKSGQPLVTEFKVSSAGSIVRETMFPGTPHEMTNVYRLEGNALAVTHYCAMGNQPEFHATELVGDQMPFHFVGVADQDAPDEMYMGGLTLEFVDKDHFNEHWSSFVKGKLQADQAVDMAFTRRK